MTDALERLRRQVEFYFSDVNIAKDVFLKTKIAEDADGFVPLDVLMTFNRVKALTKDVKELADAIRQSEHLVISEGGLAVRRKEPLPESIQMDAQTVYVKPVPAAATLEELAAFFGRYGTVLAIWRRYLQGGKGSDKSVTAEDRVKPSIFVVFGSPEEARRFQAAPPMMEEVQLTAQMKTVYMEEKAAALAATKQKGKATGNDARSTADEHGAGAKTTTPAMPMDSSYRISECGEIANFTDVKGLWPAEEQKGVRYVFMPSKEAALVIFQDAATAERMVSSARQRAATLNGMQPQLTKLEGEEEKRLIESVEKEIADRALQNAGQSRGRGRGRSQGRGRGRKRPHE